MFNPKIFYIYSYSYYLYPKYDVVDKYEITNFFWGSNYEISNYDKIILRLFGNKNNGIYEFNSKIERSIND